MRLYNAGWVCNKEGEKEFVGLDLKNPTPIKVLGLGLTFIALGVSAIAYGSYIKGGKDILKDQDRAFRKLDLIVDGPVCNVKEAVQTY